MKAWLSRLKADLSVSPASAADLARSELSAAFPGMSFHVMPDPAEGESYRVKREEDGSYTVSGGETGVLYGAYALIRCAFSGRSLPASLFSSPKYALRMINCWDNADGTVERGYSGRSLFFENGKMDYDPLRMRELARLMASVGLNVLCINNVNVHYPAQLLLEDWLPEAAALAALFRPFGVRLMFSVDFSQPMLHGIPTADPLDPAVKAWWKDTASKVYQAIPDLAGFLVKADSEGRPGPFTYGRDHADGANMLADAVRPFGGSTDLLISRCGNRCLRCFSG